MWGDFTTDDELEEMERFAQRIVSMAREIKALRKELAAFDSVRRYVNPELVKSEPSK